MPRKSQILTIIAGIVIISAITGILTWGGLLKSCKSNADLGRYNRWGMNLTNMEAKLLVSSNLPDVRSFYAPVEDYDYLNTPENTIFKIATQSGIMDYFLGYFDRWENIAGSTDRLLVAKDQPEGRDFRFRVAFDETLEWGENPTVVRFKSGKSETMTVAELKRLGKLKKIRKNNVVVLLPGLFLPEYQRRDEQGNIWVSEVVNFGCLK